MKGSWIYDNTKDNRARFLLGQKGTRSLICMGINPSTAVPEKLDNTLSSVRRFARDLGYDAWLMLNVYPQRATDPGHLHAEINMDYHWRNLTAMESVFKRSPCHIWAAWGTIIKKRKYLLSCLRDIYALARRYRTNWFRIGRITKEGHPHHPLYLKKDSPLMPFDMKAYMKEEHG